VDAELARRIRSGDYVVDAQATAAAIVKRGGLDAPSRSDVLVARELDELPAGPDQLEPLPADDLS
jgi:hypothetical protein